MRPARSCSMPGPTRVTSENGWGPNGFTTTTSAMEVRVGGAWDYVMHGPDGTDYPGRGVYTEVERPKRLAFSHVGGKADDPHLTCRMCVTFEERDGKTRLTLRMIFPSAAAAGHARALGADPGGHESLARLAEFTDAAAARASGAGRSS